MDKIFKVQIVPCIVSFIGKVLLDTYKTIYYAGEASLTEHRLGKGRVLHLGSAFSRSTVRRLFEETGILEPFSAWIAAPEGVKLVMREKTGRKFVFVLNFQQYEQKLTLKKASTLLYTRGSARRATSSCRPSARRFMLFFNNSICFFDQNISRFEGADYSNTKSFILTEDQLRGRHSLYIAFFVTTAFACSSVNYHLSTEAAYPAAVCDCKRARYRLWSQHLHQKNN